MHTEMWEHPAVQENLSVLRSRGTIIVPPEEGRLAGGDIGKGRLAAPEVVVDAVIAALTTGQDLLGLSVVVTAGGTREPIDPVRFIGNRSSGKQGHALAEAARQRGASVTLITTSDLSAHPTIERQQVSTAAEMLESVTAASARADIVIMAAAVADFRPSQTAASKIKKADGTPTVELVPTVDILAGLGAAKRAGQTLVGFAAETNDVADNARSKLIRKQADLIVANDVSAPGVGFANDTNVVSIFAADGTVTEVGMSDKLTIAHAVVDAALRSRR